MKSVYFRDIYEVICKQLVIQEQPVLKCGVVVLQLQRMLPKWPCKPLFGEFDIVEFLFTSLQNFTNASLVLTVRRI